jgi:hypothetical protein
MWGCLELPSGTTQCARAVITSIKRDDDVDTGLRQIKFHKNQYGPPSSACFVRYTNGLFLPVAGMSMGEAERATKADEIFITLPRQFTEQNRKVSANVNPVNYAPTTFARLPEAWRQGGTGETLPRQWSVSSRTRSSRTARSAKVARSAAIWRSREPKLWS